MRKDILRKSAQLRQWVTEKRSKAFICRELHCKPDTLNAYLKRLGLNYKGNRGAKGYKVDKKRLSAIDLSKKIWVTSDKLRKRLIADGLKKHQCERCLSTSWNDQPIPLELDHIDGNHFNNDLKNLRILCPNCHAQTPTNSGSNVKRGIVDQLAGVATLRK